MRECLKKGVAGYRVDGTEDDSKMSDRGCAEVSRDQANARIVYGQLSKSGRHSSDVTQEVQHDSDEVLLKTSCKKCIYRPSKTCEHWCGRTARSTSRSRHRSAHLDLDHNTHVVSIKSYAERDNGTISIAKLPRLSRMIDDKILKGP